MTHPPYHIHWTDFVSIDVVRSRTGQLLLSDTIGQLPLSFFGHLCRADTGQDHSRAVRACIRGPPKDWRLRAGRPWHTWLKTVEDDLRPLNFGLATARRRAMDRPAWRLLVDAAIRPRDTSQRERERQDKWFVPCSTDRCRQREFDIRGRRLRANYIQALLPVISGRLNYTRNTCQVGPK